MMMAMELPFRGLKSKQCTRNNNLHTKNLFAIIRKTWLRGVRRFIDPLIRCQINFTSIQSRAATADFWAKMLVVEGLCTGQQKQVP
jgi:hypothetical protein